MKLYIGSSDDDSYSFQGFDNLDSPEVLFIETISINRINGQLTNPSKFNETKKTIARINTLIKEK